MKHVIWMVLLLAVCSAAFAQKSGVGIGMMISDTPGLNVKAWLNEKAAIVASASWTEDRKEVWEANDYVTKKEKKTTTMLDYVWHTRSMMDGDIAQVLPYFGIGFRVNNGDKTEFNARMPIGIDFEMQTIPVDLYLEFVPMMKFNPSTEADAAAALGMRYWFIK